MVDLPHPPARFCSRAESRASTARAEPRTSSERLSFVDGLRLVAAVQMIQGHTVDALLARELRSGPWFSAWTFARGLTSTTFLFTAGVSFALAHAAAEARGRPAAARAHRLRRALLLVGVGYLLRIPAGVLLGDAPEAALRNWLAVDILQCIGASLLLLEGLYAVVRDRRRAAVVAALLGSACFAFAPASERLTAGLPWLALSNYVGGRDGSLFPLLPAAGYVFWGLTVSQLALLPRALDVRVQRVEANGAGPSSGARPALQLAGWGLCALAVWFALASLGPAAAPRVSPAYAALKLGLVLLFAALLARLLRGRGLPRRLTQLGSETLFLYVSHVLVLYAGHVGLAALVGRSQSLGAALCWTLGLLICTSLGALSYGPALRALRARFQRGTPRPPSPLSLG